MQRATAWLCNTRSLSGSNAQQAASLCHVRHQSSGPTQQTKPTGAAGQAVGYEEDSTPPSAARAIATMGAGGKAHDACWCHLLSSLDLTEA